MTGQRCREAVDRAIQRIDEARTATELGSGDEVVASELRMALDELGQVAGTVVNNDILDALFSRFCIGK
jgi:tRNA modification GTPase